ncbi:MAG: hypothetical protein ACRDT0_04800 [Pseudonocardiaceae bacterium]
MAESRNLPGRLGTRLRWKRDRKFDEFTPIRYLTEGEATVDSDILQRILTDLVISVLDRLRERGVAGTPLEKEWESLNSLDHDERLYCFAAAQLDFDAFAEADEYESAIIGAAERLPQELLRDFFDAVHVERLVPAVDWLTTATAEANALVGEESDDIKNIRRALASHPVSNEVVPYRIGWNQARVVRQALGLDDESRLAVDQYVSQQFRPGVDTNLQAVGIARGHARPAVVLGRRVNASATRFILSRVLWHRLARDEVSFLVTTAYTYTQKMERAFVAELLAPAAGIEARLEVRPN